MKVHLQWAKQNPQGWETHNLTKPKHVRALAKRPPPSGPPSLDDDPGWLVAVNIQGVTASGWDHIAITINGEKVTLSCWNDDPEDWPPGERWGQVWTFLPLAPDYNLPGKLKGHLNTRQTSTMYAENDNHGLHQPWSEFPMPDEDVTFHGTWLTGWEWSAHETKQTRHGWKEWAE